MYRFIKIYDVQYFESNNLMREINNYLFRKKNPRLFKYIQLHVYTTNKFKTNQKRSAWIITKSFPKGRFIDRTNFNPCKQTRFGVPRMANVRGGGKEADGIWVS